MNAPISPVPVWRCPAPVAEPDWDICDECGSYTDLALVGYSTLCARCGDAPGADEMDGAA